jgi:hypothetical protein
MYIITALVWNSWYFVTEIIIWNLPTSCKWTYLATFSTLLQIRRKYKPMTVQNCLNGSIRRLIQSLWICKSIRPPHRSVANIRNHGNERVSQSDSRIQPPNPSTFMRKTAVRDWLVIILPKLCRSMKRITGLQFKILITRSTGRYRLLESNFFKLSSHFLLQSRDWFDDP